MKKLLVIVALIFVNVCSYGQILTFEFAALGGAEATAVSNFNNANLTTSTITRGAGLTASANGGRFNATTWAATSIANAVAGNDYMEFTVTPNSGFQFSVSSVFIQLQRSASGPSAIALRNSLDGYAANLDTQYTITDNTTTQTFTFTFSQANSTSAVTYRVYMYAEDAVAGSGGIGDGTGNDIIVNGTVTPVITGIESSGVTQNWNLTTTWVGGVIPTSSDNAIIKSGHTVTVNDAAYSTRNLGTTTTVELGGTLQTGMTYTNNGTTTVNGTFRINAGGFATGNSFVYGVASTLNMNHANSTVYGINGPQAFWPVANPPYNVTVSANSPTRLDIAVGPVLGLLQVSSELDVNLPNSLRVEGTLRINAGGNIDTNGPIYGSSSTLEYRSGGLYGRSFEWNASGIGTIGVTPGYPNNVTIPTANTVLDYINGAASGAVGVKAIAGTLTISNATAALHMNYGSVSAGGELVIGGNIVLTAGTLTLGQAVGDDLKVGGNMTVTAPNGIFNGNNRRVYFTSTSALQLISGTALTIPYIVYQPASVGIQLTGAGTNLTISAPLGGNAITFNSASDIFDINSRSLTIGTAGVANTITGGGTFRGSATSSLTLLGTGSIGNLAFSGTAAQQTLGTFTVNRTTGAIACVMGSQLTVATAMNLTAGIVDLDVQTFTLNATTTLTGASSSNYFIADNAFGGILRRGYTAAGSFTFPIGDKTGTMEYSPATVNFSAGTFTGAFLGMSVNDSKHPNMITVIPIPNFISRYWSVTSTGITAPNYTFTGNYLPADVNGSETVSQSQQWNGTTWSPMGSPLGSNTLTYGGVTTLPTVNHFSGGFRDQEINVRVAATPYPTGSTYAFGNVSAGSNASATFTIENLGNRNLLLFANTAVVAPFSISSAPFTYNVTIGSSGTATFTIQFAPTLAGPFSGSITFTTNDSDEASYTINFTGTGTGSNLSDILRVTASEPTTISSTNIGTISTITDGVEVWRFNLRDGGATGDADALPTTMTGLVLTQAAGDAIGNWDETIQDIVLVNTVTSAIVAYGVVSTNQVSFTGMNVVAADNNSVLLALRLTLRCPLGVGAIDGDDFVFTISNPNLTLSPAGSGKTTFAAQSSTDGRNAINILATQLSFTTQPITTGVSTGMTNVVVTGTDACGNRDRQFLGTVSLTSTGTMNAVTPVTAVLGQATFSGIIHTVTGTDFNLIATSTGPVLTPGTSTLFDISTVTILSPGDLAVLAVNTNTEIASGTDLISFVCFRDLLPGTTLFITDNGYERQFANLWGGTEGVIVLTRTGSTLPKGTIITIETTTANATLGSHFNVYTCGSIDANWTKSGIGGSGFNLNSDDDVWFMQGGVWTNNTAHTSTYTGNVLYGWTESGWNTVPGGTSEDTRWSTLFPGMECFSTIAPTGDGFVKFDDPVNPDFTTTTNGKFDWIALINNQLNWDSYSNNTTFNAGGYDFKAGCNLVELDTDIYVNGKWSGRKDTNWFDCENWETLIVPDETIDVLVADTSYDREASIDENAPLAIYSGYIAKARNLTISGEKVKIEGNNLDNKLEVHGNLTITNSAADNALDMNDGNTSTPDGQLYLYGNWINNKNNDAFNEGNGTVHFVGTATQTINAVTPLGTESFYNVILDNNFNTSASNDLMATGNLTVSAARTLTAASGDYVRVDNQLTNNGSILIEDDAQLIQVNDGVTNNGDYTTANRFQVRRTYTAKDIDYVYWSSPLMNYNVNGIPAGFRYLWNPTVVNSNGTMGNWNPASGTMTPGKGYIARTFNGFAAATPVTHTFRNQAPNNGLILNEIKRGDFDGADYLNSNNITVTRLDDNWNLVGNPYPSAIDALKFLALNNTKVFPAIWIWKHGLGLSENPDPYYYNFGYNYLPDYLMYNSMGSTDPWFTGKIASGQGFMVNMLHSAGTLLSSSPDVYRTDLLFNNSLRFGSVSNSNEVFDNSRFYRTLNPEASSVVGNIVEKSRIWLDIFNDASGEIDTTLLGYATNATMGIDNPYDCFFAPRGKVSLYSLIEDKKFIIQGRALPFDYNDKVPMGLNIAQAGNHTIAIKKTDGIFDEDITIYLEDKNIGIIHNLKENPYHFTSIKGTFDDRFVIRYTTNSLDNQNFENIKNSVVVASNDRDLTIKSYLENLDQVTIYDVLGRQLYYSKDIQNKDLIITNVSSSNQSLIVKIKLQNGQIVTKKIVL
ncbi:T9SS sorting signal type C domain-containing protein [Flavobacterium dankookense]|uniref:HYDIN/VesB/CFA65-like Ig-like domain-containing protein n=1 Tax=Flavobacterium dankookense TaxID=706186 RepID=A0A4R6Q9N2_9FLAO|nr:T9SS sorting signal type C domain-containing protein [Flavobacterium dankookense]TDP58885.1 hypothetical protein BC748_2130 [Flavobacterium dankookense]